MTVITFDTLRYSKTLIATGVPARQAEGQAEALAAVIQDQIPTKQNLEELGMRMGKLEVKVDGLENKILTKLGGLILVCTAILGIIISMHH